MQFIITSKDELSNIVENAVQTALDKAIIPSQQDDLPKDKIYGAIEAADFLGIAKPTLYTKTSNGTIPHFKRGKRLYFRESDLIQWIEEGKKKTIQEEEQDIQSYLQNKENS